MRSFIPRPPLCHRSNLQLSLTGHLGSHSSVLKYLAHRLNSKQVKINAPNLVLSSSMFIIACQITQNTSGHDWRLVC